MDLETEKRPSAHIATAPHSIFPRLQSISDSPLFAYAAILLLQLRIIWNIWRFKDLTTGDTCCYFVDAWNWFAEHKVTKIVYSPLYTTFYGSLLSLTQDAYRVTLLHRGLILLAAAVLMLAVMRRLLSPTVAWFVAAWWIVLPVNYDALYEVHLFAVLPILAAWWVALRPNPGPWVRGNALAILFGTTFLVRFETLIAAGCFSIICLIYELRNLRAGVSMSKPATVVAGYLVPFVILCGVLGWFCSRSTMGLKDALLMLHDKETATMGQWFAFGFQQRHPDWTGIPWTDYPELTSRLFGTPTPTPTVMMRRNPREFASHVLWNFRMAPAGMQLSLFNCAAGHMKADINPSLEFGSPVAWIWTTLLIAIMAVGLRLGWRDRNKWKDWFANRQLGWLAMLSVAAGAPLMLITSPPRPEIFFCHTIVLMALAGMAVVIISSRWQRPAWSGALIPAVLLTALIFSPRHFSRTHNKLPPLAETYERLRPSESLINSPGAVFLQSRWEMDNYIGHGRGKILAYEDFDSAWSADASLANALDRKGITLFYLDRHGVWLFSKKHAEPLRQFMNGCGEWGWHVVRHEHTPQTQWILFQRTTQGQDGRAISNSPDSTAPTPPP